MLIIFAVPKPFRGHIDIIQRNAIKSWTLLQPRPEIVLFGNEENTAAVCKDYGLRHVPEIARNEYGTPLLNDVFKKAQSQTSYDVLCFVNADIILMSDFMKAMRQVCLKKRRFLMIGRRWNLKIDKPIQFGEQNWEAPLKVNIQQQGFPSGNFALDYFVFNRGLFENIPPFAIGRFAWDNWLIYKGRSCHALVIDASRVVTAIHQCHEPVRGKKGLSRGPEAARNMELLGDLTHVFSLDDATLILTHNGLRYNPTPYRIYRHFKSIPLFYPQYKLLANLVKILIKISDFILLSLSLKRKLPKTINSDQ